MIEIKNNFGFFYRKINTIFKTPKRDKRTRTKWRKKTDHLLALMKTISWPKRLLLMLVFRYAHTFLRSISEMKNSRGYLYLHLI